MMKSSNEFNTLNAETIAAALRRGRLERSRAFHEMWKSAVRSFR